MRDGVELDEEVSLGGGAGAGRSDPGRRQIVMLVPQPSTCVKVDLPCVTRVRRRADANAELVADIVAAL
jgi:hypothetical protein